MQNLLKKIDWAEIAGQALLCKQEKGYLRAIVMMDMYGKRADAEQAAHEHETWSKASRKVNGKVNYRSTDDAKVQQKYRKMVKANHLAKHIK